MNHVRSLTRLKKNRTESVIEVASFFKSSVPRLAIWRVVSVMSCLHITLLSEMSTIHAINSQSFADVSGIFRSPQLQEV